MIELPLFELSASSYTERIAYSSLSVCLKNLVVSQYCRYDFNSLCGKLAAGEEGIFVLDNSETDNGVTIDSLIELPLTDFGTSYQKRLRSVYIGGEAQGNLKLIVSEDEGDEREYSLEPLDGKQQGGKVSINRDRKGRYWQLKIKNVEGCDFSLDSIEIIPVVLGRKPNAS